MDAMIFTEHVKKLDENMVSMIPWVARVKVHEHLGMTIDFSLKLGVAIS